MNYTTDPVTKIHSFGRGIPFDPRFPNQNQTRNCWQNYVDYYRCINLRGEDYEPCQFFFKNFTTLCPFSWVEKWDSQREEGTFPAELDLKKKLESKK